MPSQPLHAPDASRTLATALTRAASALGLPRKTLARITGISPASASRLSQGRGVDPATKEGELSLLFLRVVRSLDSLLGGNAANMRAWLSAHNDHLGGTPADLIQTVTGLVSVAEYLDAMRGKV